MSPESGNLYNNLFGESRLANREDFSEAEREVYSTGLEAACAFIEAKVDAGLLPDYTGFRPEDEDVFAAIKMYQMQRGSAKRGLHKTNSIFLNKG